MMLHSKPLIIIVALTDHLADAFFRENVQCGDIMTFKSLRHMPFCLECMYVCMYVFVALRPMSTAMVIAGPSVHLSTLFPGQA